MRSSNKNLVARLAQTFKRIETAIVEFARRRAAERRHRRELEAQFYRDLKKYYADNKLPPPILWEEDFRMQR